MESTKGRGGCIGAGMGRALERPALVVPGVADPGLRAAGAAICPPTPVLERGRGGCEVGFRCDEAGVTRLAHLYQTNPCRVLFPRPEPGELATAVVVTTSGGLAGGDRLDLAFSAGAGARAVVMAQAAEKIYRSTGAETEVAVGLTVGPGGWLEWLPQETILFDGSRLRRGTEVRLAPGARLLAGEFLVLGRLARGERFTHGLLHDGWKIWRDGRLIWVDALRLDGDVAALVDHPAGWNGMPTLFTLILAADAAGQELAFVRSFLETTGVEHAGATVLDGLLICRLLGRSPWVVRRAVAGVWAGLRHRVAGLLPAVSPLWNI